MAGAAVFKTAEEGRRKPDGIETPALRFTERARTVAAILATGGSELAAGRDGSPDIVSEL